MCDEKKPIFCIIDWTDGFWNDIPMTCIKEPRKSLEDYSVGEPVIALLPSSGKHSGVIAAIDGDRDWLKKVASGPRPIPARHAGVNHVHVDEKKREAVETKRKSKDSVVSQDNVTDDSDSDSVEMEKSLTEKIETNKKDNMRFLEACGLLSLKKAASKSSKSSTSTENKKGTKAGSKRKLCEEDQSSAQAKKDENKKRREQRVAREETLTRATREILNMSTPEKTPAQPPKRKTPRRSPRLSSTSQHVSTPPKKTPRRSPRVSSICTPSQQVSTPPTHPVPASGKSQRRLPFAESGVSEASFEKLSRKVDFIASKMDDCLNAINSMRSCRACAKKLLKSFDETKTSPMALFPGPRFDCHFSPPTIFSTKSDVEPMSRSTTATATIMPEPKQEKMVAEKGAEENRGGEAEKGGDQVSVLSYIGEARLGVQIKKETLERCMSTAKTATKLALNLIEFLIPEDLMKTGVSVYGNAQFRLKSMPSNMVAALKGHVFSNFLESTREEEENTWKEIVKKLNKKIQNIRNGKYQKQ